MNMTEAQLRSLFTDDAIVGFHNVTLTTQEPHQGLYDYPTILVDCPALKYSTEVTEARLAAILNEYGDQDTIKREMQAVTVAGKAMAIALDLIKAEEKALPITSKHALAEAIAEQEGTLEFTRERWANLNEEYKEAKIRDEDHAINKIRIWIDKK